MPRLIFRPALVLLLLSLGLSISTVFALPVFASPLAHAVNGPVVNAWLTTTDGQNALTPQSNLVFTSGSGTTGSLIHVNDNQQFQQMLGFGAAMTDTSAYLIGTQMSSSQRTAVMQSLFSSTNGIGLSFVRIPMGSSDYTATPPTNPQPYSYDDQSAGQTDPTLSHFSISHDTTYIIPTLQQALQINPNLTFMANPWSPPAWMKTNDSMIGNGNGQKGTLISSDYGPLAQYFVKFIQAYQAQGLPIYAITPQNEPLYVPSDYPGMSWAASDENSFIKNNLAPALAGANLHTNILGYDHDWAGQSYAQTLLSDPTTNNDLAGIAWHCYNGHSSAMTSVHNQYPNKDEYETECSTGPTGIAPLSAIDTALTSVQNWAKTVELWNIALNPAGGPRMSSACGGCTGLVTIDPTTGVATPTINYYGLGQVSKFVQPGAYHIGSSSIDNTLNNAAFTNSDGSKVLVVHNTSSASKTLSVSWNSTQAFSYTLPAGGIVTFKWTGVAKSLVAGYAINTGGTGVGMFAADGYYSGGQTYSTSASITTAGVTNPAPQAVYQTERYGNVTYTLPNLIPGAQYSVRLHFAEIYWTSSGQRLFNVAINGQQVLSNFDIYATAGGNNRAIVEQYTATADLNGQLAIQFSTVRDNAKVSGIEVKFASLAINAGGSTSNTFTTDTFASGGQTYSTSASITTSGVTNPAPQAVYQTERFGDVTYTIPSLVAGQSYTVRLHFAEIRWTSSGQRLFNVSINGQQVLSNFDIYATAGGANKAVVEQYTATADPTGQITIQFSTVKDNAKVNGIQVIA